MKDQLRAEIAERRASLTPYAREDAAANLAQWIYAAPFRLEYDVTVAAYIPLDNEPGSLALLDALLDRGVTVIVPVVPDGPAAPLDWVRYDGTSSRLRSGRWGLTEPEGDRLGPDAVEAAAVVFVPALAIDAKGNRLGRGAGYYDRSLDGAKGELVGVVYDDEIVETLTAEPHDIRVGWTLTPSGGFRRVG